MYEAFFILTGSRARRHNLYHQLHFIATLSVHKCRLRICFDQATNESRWTCFGPRAQVFVWCWELHVGSMLGERVKNRTLAVPDHSFVRIFQRQVYVHHPPRLISRKIFSSLASELLLLGLV